MNEASFPRWVLPLTLGVMALGCAKDIGDDPLPDAGGAPDAGLPPGTDGGPPVDAGPPESEVVRHTDLGDGSTETLVDASYDDTWILFDLETSSHLTEVSDPFTTGGEWDLAFQRYHFRLNGGEGGAGDAAVAILDGADFDALTQAPEGEYLQDVVDGDDDDELPDFAISAGPNPWWDYDPTFHTLTPKDRVYAVRSAQGNYFALEVVDYYHPDTGASGFPAFRWKPIDPPEGVELPGIEVDASDAEAWIYLDLDGEELSVGDESTDGTWDLALQRTNLRTSSGVSGPGVGGARLAEVTWDALETTTTVGFAVDTLVPLPGPPGSGEAPGNEVLAGWYDYDPATHAVSPGERVYVIRGADGDYAKLRVLAWEDGIYRLELERVERDVDTRDVTIDASDAEAWVHYSFRMGALVETETPEDDDRWDVAFSRTNVRTNSGTSGTGEGGAADPEVAELTGIDEVPETFTVDEDVPLPGPPGSGTLSANAVLGGWYDYDPVTHRVSAGERAYVLRTADGGYVKLRITSWSDGELEIDWAYAGAGQDDFGGSE